MSLMEKSNAKPERPTTLYTYLASLCDHYDMGLSLCQEPLDLIPGDATRCRTLGGWLCEIGRGVSFQFAALTA